MDDKPAGDTPQSTGAVNASAQAIVENADRLGLTWQLRPATVGVISPAITVQVDGDSEFVTATSMIGAVSAGQRVYVILVPPSGVFITGIAGTSGSPYYRRIEFLASNPAANFFDLPILSEIQISYIARSSSAVTNTNLRLRVNDVISASYNTENIQAVGAGLSSALVDSGATAAFVGSITGASANASNFGYGNIWFHAPDSLIIFPSWTYHNANIVSGGIHDTGGGVMVASKAPILKIQLFPETGFFAVGTVFTMKGTYA